MKTKSNMPLTKWLWMFGIYLGCCVIGLIICAILVSRGNITLEGSKIAIAIIALLGGIAMGLISKGLPILGIIVPTGILVLFNTACCILVFTGIGKDYLLCNSALLLGGLLGFWFANRNKQAPKGKRRRKYSGKVVQI